MNAHPPTILADEGHSPQLPPGAGKLGMWLFLAALFMLFAASILAYVIIRLTGTHSPDAGEIRMPAILWGSTVAMIGSSVTIHLALSAIRRGLQSRFRLMMLATLVMVGLFLAMQIPGLAKLLSQHHELMDQMVHIYGLLFVIILLHAMHILGGLLPLLVAVLRAQQGSRYTQDNHNGILYLAMYWHFLDGVWIAMFAVFLAMG